MSRLSIVYGRIRFLDAHADQETLIPREHPIRETIGCDIDDDTGMTGRW